MEGYSTSSAETGEAGLALLEEKPFDLLLLDVSLPDRNGLDLLREIRRRDPSFPSYLITAYGSIDMARAAFKGGAQDYITKPWSNDELLVQVAQAVEGRRLREENVQLKRALKQRYNFPNIIGKSDKMLAVLDLVTQVAPSRSTVLIHGRKRNRQRTDRQGDPFRFHAIRQGICANQYRLDSRGPAGVATVWPREGRVHQRRSFKKGLFEVADQGTIFFDEISTIGPETQAKLLRVIQEREFMRLGGTETIKVDVESSPLAMYSCSALVREGRFREDLYHRLNVIAIPSASAARAQGRCSAVAGSFSGEILGRKRPAVHASHPLRSSFWSITTGREMCVNWKTWWSAGWCFLRRNCWMSICFLKVCAQRNSSVACVYSIPIMFFRCRANPARVPAPIAPTIPCFKSWMKPSAASSATCSNARAGIKPRRRSCFRFLFRL